jgi:hypothetical protein
MSPLHSTIANLVGALDQMIYVLRPASSLGRLPDQVLLLSLSAKIQLLRDDVITELALEYEKDKTAILKLADDLCKSGHQAPLAAIDYLLGGIASAGPEMLLPRALAARTGVRSLQIAITKIDASASPAAANGVPKQRNTMKCNNQIKLIAALTQHHQYADGSCLNAEPIGNNELARQAEVGRATANRFFDKWFGGHAVYCGICRRNTRKLVDTIKAMNGEFVPASEPNYGAVPPAESDRD